MSIVDNFNTKAIKVIKSTAEYATFASTIAIVALKNTAGYANLYSSKVVNKIKDGFSTVFDGIFSRLNLTSNLVDTKGELTSGTITRASGASYIDTSGVLQIADGDSTPFSSDSVENETGATEMRGSFVDAQAWFHDAGGLLAAYAGTGNLLIAADGAGVKAYGYIGAAGTGETLGSIYSTKMWVLVVLVIKGRLPLLI